MCNGGGGRFFNAARDTVSDKFLMTYKAGLPKQPVPPAERALAVAEERTVETWEATEGDAR